MCVFEKSEIEKIKEIKPDKTGLKKEIRRFSDDK